MINELLSRPNIQEFLNKYPSSRWKELITDLFEIGILNLKNSYNRYEFSRNEFYALIKDLEHPSHYPGTVQNYQNNRSQSNNQHYNDNYSSNYYSQNNFNKKYSNENMTYNNSNYDYERRMNRLRKLENRATTSKMDAFYSEKNETPKKKECNKRRTHREIMDKIFWSHQRRYKDRCTIRDLKRKHMQQRKEERNKKRIEKMIERQAEEDIKEEENIKRMQKQEEDAQEGFYEDYQEEEEPEEEDETDKYNDPNRGYDDEDEEGEEEEQINEGQ